MFQVRTIDEIAQEQERILGKKLVELINEVAEIAEQVDSATIDEWERELMRKGGDRS